MPTRTQDPGERAQQQRFVVDDQNHAGGARRPRTPKRRFGHGRNGAHAAVSVPDPGRLRILRRSCPFGSSAAC
jgi:hypothetical protein